LNFAIPIAAQALRGRQGKCCQRIAQISFLKIECFFGLITGSPHSPFSLTLMMMEGETDAYS
jgi:hypothetical protein